MWHHFIIYINDIFFLPRLIHISGTHCETVHTTHQRIFQSWFGGIKILHAIIAIHFVWTSLPIGSRCGFRILKT